MARSPVAEHLQQTLLEHAQYRLERRSAAQLLEGVAVVIEQLRQRVMARRELQQQLIEIEACQQGGLRQRGRDGGALGAGELRRLTTSAP